MTIFRIKRSKMFLDFPKRHSIIIQIHAKSDFLLVAFHLPKTIVDRKSFTTIFTPKSLNVISMLCFSYPSLNNMVRSTKDTRNFFILLCYYFLGFHLFSDVWNLGFFGTPLTLFSITI